MCKTIDSVASNELRRRRCLTDTMGVNITEIEMIVKL